MKLNTRLIIFFTCFVLLLGAVALPLFAQDSTTTEDSDTVMVTGAVHFSDSGDIMVGEYIIAPAGAFQPAILHEGDIVIITGRLLPDGMTVQADTFEFFDDSVEVTPEATDEATPEVTPEATVEATPEATPETTPEATEEPLTCGNPNHPVATAIAEEFGVSVDVVIGMHCSGFGFGEIARAFLLAESTGGDAQSFLDMKAGGQGWGQIMREAGVHPSDLAPGHIMHGHDDEATAEDESSTTNTQGNGNGNGRGNSGNGNGGGNGGNGNGGGKGGKGN